MFTRALELTYKLTQEITVQTISRRMGSVIVRSSDGNCSVTETYSALLNSALYGTRGHVEITVPDVVSVDVPDNDTIVKAVDNVILVIDAEKQRACSVCLVNIPQFTYYPCKCKCVCGPCLRTFIHKAHESLYSCPNCLALGTKSIA